MDSIDWLRIKKNWLYLLTNLDTEHVLPYLYNKGAINDKQKEMIEIETLSYSKRDKLLKILKTKENGYKKLCKALRQQQVFIVQKLQQTTIDDNENEKLKIQEKLAPILLDQFHENKDSSLDLSDIYFAVKNELGQDIEEGVLIETVCETFVDVNHTYEHGMHIFFNLKKKKSTSVQGTTSSQPKVSQRAEQSLNSRLTRSQDLETGRIQPEMEVISTFGTTFDTITEEECPKQYSNKTLKIINKSKTLVSYSFRCDGNQTKTHTYFDLVGATSRRSYNVRCYMSKHFDSIYEGLTYKFDNLIKRGKEFWLTRDCVFHYTASIDVQQKVLNKATILPDEAPNEGIYRSLSDAASWHAALSFIKGKIVAVSPLRYLRGDELAILSLQLKDTSGTEKVTLFQDNAKLHFKKNHIVQITRVVHKTYRGKSYLSTTRDSICKVISDKTLKHLRVNEEDYPQDDEDFKEDEDNRHNISVNEFRNVYIYPCCNARACRKIKMRENGCPKCGQPSDGLSCVVHFLFRFQNNDENEFPIFEDDLRKILDEDLILFSKESLIRQICRKLPLKFSCVIKGNVISNVQPKRGEEVL